MPPPYNARCATISHSLDTWLNRHCPFRIAIAPSTAVAVALPSCHPSPPSLVDCCRFHCHRCVNVHPPLLPSRSLCCACHHRPLPSRHPLPPLLVDCQIFHVHCRIAVHRRCSVAPTIAVDAVAVALPLRWLVDCCLAVVSHCNCRADHCCHHCCSVAPSIAVASLSRLQSHAVAIASPLHLPLPSSLRCCRVVHHLR